MSAMMTMGTGQDADALRMSARLDLALDIAARKAARRWERDAGVTPRSMWELVRWTYGTQQVRARPWSVARWSDVLFALDMPDGPACAYHVDAVVTHAAICLLPPHQRDVVWGAAESGMVPPIPPASPRARFRPVMREGRGHAGPLVCRYWQGCVPLPLRPMELRRLADGQTRAEREIVISEGSGRWRYRYDPRAVTYRRRAGAPTLIDRRTGRVRESASVLAEIEVPYCPIRWVVDLAALAGAAERYAHFHSGIVAAYGLLSGRALYATSLGAAGVAPPPAMDRALWRGPSRREMEIIAAAWPDRNMP